MKTIGIIACSNAQSELEYNKISSLIEFLNESDIHVVAGKYIYEHDREFVCNGKKRAAELMKMYENPDITEIYDVSGGDMANEILDYLDFKKIQAENKIFWGYSDLTVVLNAIYTMTAQPGVLYQVKNLADEKFKDVQRQRYIHRDELFDPSFEMIQGDCIKGIVVGGNIRCFLKLAGTKYFPDMTDKVLLIESLGGRIPQMITYLSQLKSLGVFEKIKGILMGTFTTMEEEQLSPDMITLVKEFAGKDIPIAKTSEIGHGRNSKAIWIGKEVTIA